MGSQIYFRQTKKKKKMCVSGFGLKKKLGMVGPIFYYCYYYMAVQGNLMNFLYIWGLNHCIAGLGGSVGCAVRLETWRSRVQPPPRSATFFRGD